MGSSVVRFIWPKHTPCPQCAWAAYEGLRTIGRQSLRRCRACGHEWHEVATHREQYNPTARRGEIVPIL